MSSTSPRHLRSPFRAGAFDTVFIDAPCSGPGTIRRDLDIRWKRQAADLADLPPPSAYCWIDPPTSCGQAAS